MRMHARHAFALLLGAGAAGSAAAGDLALDLTGTGFVELYYAAREDADDGGGLFGDFDLSFRPRGGAFGFDLGALADRSDDEGNGILYWAGTWYTPGGGKFSVGNPRSAYDLFERSVHNDALGALGNFVLRSQMQQDEFFDGGAQFGASYLGQAGALGYGVSLHGYDVGGSTSPPPRSARPTAGASSASRAPTRPRTPTAARTSAA